MRPTRNAPCPYRNQKNLHVNMDTGRYPTIGSSNAKGRRLKNDGRREKEEYYDGSKCSGGITPLHRASFLGLALISLLTYGRAQDERRWILGVVPTSYARQGRGGWEADGREIAPGCISSIEGEEEKEEWENETGVDYY
jgi:hypothetical protein